MTNFKYEDVLPIKAYSSSIWLVKFEQGQQLLQVWHNKAKIEDVASATNVHFPGTKFTVTAISVGVFWLHHVEHSYSNGRMINQSMEVVIDG